MLKIKRIYEKSEPSDGRRILVDRLWPRGLRKEKAKIDRWLKDLAPSAQLRKWFGHREERWQEFRSRYINELKEKGKPLKDLADLAKKREITLLFAARDEKRNNATVLKEFISRL